MLTTKSLLNIHRMQPSIAACVKYSIICVIHICFVGKGIYLLKEMQRRLIYVKIVLALVGKILLFLGPFFSLQVASKYMSVADLDLITPGGLVSVHTNCNLLNISCVPGVVLSMTPVVL